MQDLSQFKRTKQIVPVPEVILLIPPLTAKYYTYCIPSLVVRTVSRQSAKVPFTDKVEVKCDTVAIQ